jgi:hypothetical protein
MGLMPEMIQLFSNLAQLWVLLMDNPEAIHTRREGNLLPLSSWVFTFCALGAGDVGDNGDVYCCANGGTLDGRREARWRPAVASSGG